MGREPEKNSVQHLVDLADLGVGLENQVECFEGLHSGSIRAIRGDIGIHYLRFRKVWGLRLSRAWGFLECRLEVV